MGHRQVRVLLGMSPPISVSPRPHMAAIRAQPSDSCFLAFALIGASAAFAGGDRLLYIVIDLRLSVGPPKQVAHLQVTASFS